MRVNLTVERQGLPPSKILWSTESLTATYTAPSADPTVSQLLEQVNEVLPLEAKDWGLEDYIVEINGFECLHFSRISLVLKEGDHVTIRPLQTQDVRFRTLSGRHQISNDGRHLIDGVPFGRPFLRRGPRPPLKIPPRKRARLEVGDDEELEGQPQLFLPDGTSNLSVPEDGYHAAGDYQLGSLGEIQQTDSSAVASSQAYPATVKNVYGTLRAKKRRSSPGLEDLRAGKRVRSAPQSTILKDQRHASRTSSTSSKNVHFQEANAEHVETPATIDAPMDAEDSEDDEDFEPGEESESDSSESNKENVDPGVPKVSIKRHLTAVPASETQERDQSSPRRAEISGFSSTTSSSEEESLPEESSSEDRSIDSSSEAEAATDRSSSSGKSGKSTSSEDDDGSSATTSSSEAPSSPSETDSVQRNSHITQTANAAKPRLTLPTQQLVPPGHGMVSTQHRNRRRRLSRKLKRLQEHGQLPPTATIKDLREWMESITQSPIDTKQGQPEDSRQVLFNGFASGGIDTAANASHDPVGGQRSAGQGNNKSTLTHAGSMTQSKTPDLQAVIPASAHVHVTPPLPNKVLHSRPETDQTEQHEENLTEQNAPMPPPEKRRRLDTSGARRLLLSGLGLRMPKCKADEDELREKSRAKAQAEVGKHLKRSGTQTEAPATEQAVIDENWQEHVELKAVECSDPSIRYSTPPFPFVQRWDPKQHYDKWRNKGQGGNKQKQRNRKRYDAEIDEHFEAAMYDEAPAIAEDETIQIAPAPEKALSRSPFQSVVELQVPNMMVKPDLTAANARPGARIAFKQLELSEATEWQPMISQYKLATIVSIQDYQLLLTLDEQYRPLKQVDPQTGERVYSNFIVEGMDEGEDESTIELGLSELVEPKLLNIPPSAELSTHGDRIEPADPDGSGETAGIAISNAEATVGKDDGPRSGVCGQGTSTEGVLQTSGNGNGSGTPTRFASGSLLQSDGETAIEISFGASTQTIVNDGPLVSKNIAEGVNELDEVDSNARQEASMLIKEAGFRSAIDPEVTRVLDEQLQTNRDDNVSSTNIPRSDNTDFHGFSSFPNGEDDHSVANDEGHVSSIDGANEAEIVDNDDDNMVDTGSLANIYQAHHVEDALAKGNNAAKDSIISEDTNINGIDIVKRMMLGARPADEVHIPNAQANDDTRGMNISDKSPELVGGTEERPETGRIEGIAQDPRISAEVEDDDSLPSLEAIMSQAPSKPKKPAPGKSERRSLFLTQPARQRTRLAARRISAMSNPVMLDDDEDSEDKNVDYNASEPYPSTAPPSFRSINIPEQVHNGKRKGVAKNTMVDAVDLTQSDPVSQSSDGEYTNRGSFPSMASRAGPGWKDKIRPKKTARRRSEV